MKILSVLKVFISVGLLSTNKVQLCLSRIILRGSYKMYKRRREYLADLQNMQGVLPL